MKLETVIDRLLTAKWLIGKGSARKAKIILAETVDDLRREGVDDMHSDEMLFEMKEMLSSQIKKNWLLMPDEKFLALHFTKLGKFEEAREIIDNALRQYGSGITAEKEKAPEIATISEAY